MGSAHVSLHACGHIEAGNSDGILPIVSIQVKSKKGDHVIQTYAFLDPGRTATFCSENLMTRVNLNGQKTQVYLRTMGSGASFQLQIDRFGDSQSQWGKIQGFARGLYTEEDACKH